MADNKKVMTVAYGRIDPTNPEKKFWTNCGVLVMSVNEHGEERISLKLNVLPLDSFGNECWFSVFPAKTDAE